MREAGFTRRQFLTILGAVPVAIALPGGRVRAAALRILKLRHWSAPDHTRIVIDLDAPARFETRSYTDPARVVVEIPGAEADALRVPVEDGLVAAIEVDTQLRGTVLVRVLLQRDADVSAFPLAPNAASPAHRIVLDLGKRFTEAERRAEAREVEAVRESGDTVVAIDAGHGGTDPGCIANGIQEKDVALDVARVCAASIAGRAGMRPLLTRDKDYFVPLGKRQEIARKYGARVFVSIHCNSATNSGARGGEVFFLSPQGAADKAAKELVDRENAADLVGGVPPEEVRTPLLDILVNLKQNDAMRKSERLGEIVLRRLELVPGSEVRNLKQGPLAVLKSISCPSVLVELGFVTNRRDVRLLADGATRRLYAEQLANGVEEYLAGAG